MGSEIFTIGHSDHRWDEFLHLLLLHRVEAIVDVRSAPYSRFNPQFNRERLHECLTESGIHYVFLGNELGARRSEPECYVDGKARYDLIAETSSFRAGLERVEAGAKKYRLALMCAEKDPLTCHRTILVGRYLQRAGLSIAHILENGRLESNNEAERRLLRITGKPERDLFTSKDDAIEDAYEIQGSRIAFSTKSTSTNDGAA